MRTHRNPPQLSSGVTLIEILVAILIISFGLLGTAGLQITGLRAALSANQRTTATLLAYDMADRMRANMAGVSAGNYQGYTPTDQSATCLADVGCSPQRMAENDTWQWGQAIAAQLPQGIGIVCRDSSPDDGVSNASLISAGCDGLGNIYVIKIWWLEDRSEANTTGALKRVVTSFHP